MFDVQGNTQIASNCKGLVQAWMDAFEVKPDLELQESLVLEEALEILAVFQENPEPNVESVKQFLKEVADLSFVIFGYSIMAYELKSDRKLSDLTSAIVATALESVYFMAEFAPAASDAAFKEAFERVVASNMTKLGDDGKAIRNENGKIMKGPNYVAPDLTDLAERLLKAIS